MDLLGLNQQKNKLATQFEISLWETRLLTKSAWCLSQCITEDKQLAKDIESSISGLNWLCLSKYVTDNQKVDILPHHDQYINHLHSIDVVPPQAVVPQALVNDYPNVQTNFSGFFLSEARFTAWHSQRKFVVVNGRMAVQQQEKDNSENIKQYLFSLDGSINQRR